MQDVAISERALIQRLNRKLKEINLVVRKSKKSHPDYYIMDIFRNAVAEYELGLGDLEYMGRRLHVLAAWETVAK